MKKLKSLVYISLGLGVLATLLRVLGVIFAFDAEVEYFDLASPINISASVVLAIALCLCVLIGIVFRSRISRDAGYFKKTEKVSLLLGAALMIYGIFELYLIFTLNNAASENQFVWGAVGVLLSFVSAAYFLASFIGSSKRTASSVIVGFAFVFWCAYVIAVNYFDRFTTINNPIKLSMQLALIAAMFCLLCEFRIRLENEKKGQHIAVSLVSTILCFYFSFPAIVCFALGKTQNARYLFAAIACIAVGLYALRICFLFSDSSEILSYTLNDNKEQELLSTEAENDG